MLRLAPFFVCGGADVRESRLKSTELRLPLCHPLCSVRAVAFWQVLESEILKCEEGGQRQLVHEESEDR